MNQPARAHCIKMGKGRPQPRSYNACLVIIQSQQIACNPFVVPLPALQPSAASVTSPCMRARFRAAANNHLARATQKPLGSCFCSSRLCASLPLLLFSTLHPQRRAARDGRERHRREYGLTVYPFFRGLHLLLPALVMPCPGHSACRRVCHTRPPGNFGSSDFSAGERDE